MKPFDIVWTNQFKKDYKLAMKRHLDIDLLDNIIRNPAACEQLPEKNRDHPLNGNWDAPKYLPSYSFSLVNILSFKTL